MKTNTTPAPVSYHYTPRHLERLAHMEHLTIFNPVPLVAGVAPKGSPVYAPAYHALSSALDDEDIRFIFVENAGQVFYLGARAKDFNGTGRLGTTLAAALPGAKGHQGEGAYLSRQGQSAAAVVVKGGRLEARSGALDDVMRYVESKVTAAEIFDLSESADLAMAWESDEGLSRKFLRNLVSRLLTIGMVSVVIMSLLAAAVFAAGSYYTPLTGAQRESVTEQFNKAADELRKFNARESRGYLSEQMSSMQKVIDLALSMDGRMVFYRLEANGRAVWKVELPLWTQAKTYASLGGNLDAYAKDGFLVVTNEVKAPSALEALSAPGAH